MTAEDKARKMKEEIDFK
jgi:hypothetical protein